MRWESALQRPERIPAPVERAPLLREIFSCLDLTSLNTQDSEGSIRSFAERAAHFSYSFSDIS